MVMRDTRMGLVDFATAASAPPPVPARSYYVLGHEDNLSLNGGVAVDFVYGTLGSFTLSNYSADEVILVDAVGTEIDRVAYDEGASWPLQPGYALQYGASSTFVEDNNVGSKWCVSVEPQSGPGSDAGTPGRANRACPTSATDVTVYELQDVQSPNHPSVGDRVRVTGVVITALGAENITPKENIWVQETSRRNGSFAYGGVRLDLTGYALSNYSVGELVDVVGTYTEVDAVTTLDVTTISAVGTGTVTPVDVSSSTLDQTSGAPESWEGVLVRLSEPAVTDQNPDAASGNDYQEFRLDAHVRVDDLIFDEYGSTMVAPVDFTDCDVFSEVVGVVHHTFGNYKILPRGAADLNDNRTVVSTSANPSVSIQNAAGGGYRFQPVDVCVQPGSTVEWVNTTMTAHTVTERDPLTGTAVSTPAFDLSVPASPGSTQSHTFGDAGTYPYLCTIHPSMLGRVVVLEP
jgi:plastocyanin